LQHHPVFDNDTVRNALTLNQLAVLQFLLGYVASELRIVHGHKESQIRTKTAGFRASLRFSWPQDSVPGSGKCRTSRPAQSLSIALPVGTSRLPPIIMSCCATESGEVGTCQSSVVRRQLFRMRLINAFSTLQVN
jgi:hypothetical protein